MPPKESPLLFLRPTRRLAVTRLREFAEGLRQIVAGGREFFCLLTDDRELRRLNRQFLGKDCATDVLSFPSVARALVPAASTLVSRQFSAGGLDMSRDESRLGRHECPRHETLGEIAISTERAAAQAVEYGHGVEEEVSILMLHGLLHLLGMDHETDNGRMLRAEIRWRRKLGLPAGLTERMRA